MALRPVVAVTTVLGALTLWGAAGARADSVVYVHDGEVLFENVDGSQRRAITNDPGPVSAYVSPSIDDAGNVAALHVALPHDQPTIDYFPRGGTATRSPMPWVPGAANGPPYTARLLPESTSHLLAYTYGRDDAPFRGFVTPADAPGAPVLADDVAGRAGWRDATWLGDDLVIAAGGALTHGHRQPEISWLRTRDATTTIAGGEVSRDPGTRRLLVRIAGAGSPTRLGVFVLQGAIPEGVTIGEGCWLPVDGTPGRAAISPDGTVVSWTEGTAVRLARVTVPGGTAETCVLRDERLLTGDGGEPAFSRYTQPPPDEKPPVTTTTTTPTTTVPVDPPPVETITTTIPRTTPTTTTPHPRPLSLQAAAATRATARQLRAGLAVRLRGSGAGKATVVLRHGRSTLATAKATLPASGRRTVTVKVARRTAAKLRRGTKLTVVATLRVSGRTVSRTLRLTVR